jgi:hypothetical protein
MEQAGGAESYAVICHPQLYGGTMDNKVVTTVARAMQEVGVPLRCDCAATAAPVRGSLCRAMRMRWSTAKR